MTMATVGNRSGAFSASYDSRQLAVSDYGQHKGSVQSSENLINKDEVKEIVCATDVV